MKVDSNCNLSWSLNYLMGGIGCSTRYYLVDETRCWWRQLLRGFRGNHSLSGQCFHRPHTSCVSPWSRRCPSWHLYLGPVPAAFSSINLFLWKACPSPSQYAFLFVFSFPPPALIRHHFIDESHDSIDSEGKESASSSSMEVAPRHGY